MEVYWDVWLKALCNGFKLCCSQSLEEQRMATELEYLISVVAPLFFFFSFPFLTMKKLDTVLTKDLLHEGFGCYCI